MRAKPWTIIASATTRLAASDGWTPSQNTYWVAFEHVPFDFAGLHKTDDFSTILPFLLIPQQPLLASTNPTTLLIINN